jgi:hypothetical protein
MFWRIIGSLGVIFTKYYTAVGSRKLLHRINQVKLDLEHDRRRLKEVRKEGHDIAHDEEGVVQRVRYTKDLIDDLRIRLARADEEAEIVFDMKPISVLAVIY